MAKLPGLFQRGDIWWLRVMVPLDLRATFGACSKIVRSLDTRDRRQAIRLSLVRRAELLSAFEHGKLDAALSVPLGKPQELVALAGCGSAVAPYDPVPKTYPESRPRTHRKLRDVYEKWASVSEGGVDTKRAAARALALYEQWAGSPTPHT